MQAEKLRKDFKDPNERIIAVLGDEFVQGWIDTKTAPAAIMVLTDKRLYVFGKRYLLSSMFPTHMYGSKSIALDTIRSSGILIHRNWFAYGIALASIPVCLVLLLEFLKSLTGGERK